MKIQISFFCALFLFSTLSLGQSIIIPSQKISTMDLTRYLQKNPQEISVLDYWSQIESSNHLGLESLVEEFELSLQHRTKWSTLASRLQYSKQVSFSEDHRQLLIDFFEKKIHSLSTMKDSSEISAEAKALKVYLCAERKLESREFKEPCSAKEVSLLKLAVDPLDYPIVLVDGFELETRRLKRLSLPSISFRFVFLSVNLLPLEIVRTPEELLKQDFPRNPIYREINEKYFLETQDQTLEERGRVLFSKDEIATLTKTGPGADRSWWAQNSKWALPTLAILSGALILSQKDKTLVFNTN